MNAGAGRSPGSGDPADLGARMREALSPPLQRLLERVRDVAAETHADIWLVGGPVRDLLLGREVSDLDLAIRGDVLGLAGAVASRMGGRVRGHTRFGTASVLLEDGARMDLAAIRRERYLRPGALPEVEPTEEIEEDLTRRDFGINAMAVPLGRDDAFTLVDPCGGRHDLKEGRVRVLHEESFRDDPTRVVRALRFSGRFDYPLEDGTEEQLRSAVRDGALGTVSGIRLGAEIRSLLEEPAPLRGLVAAGEAGIWYALPPRGLPEPPDASEAFSRAADAVAWYAGLDERASLQPLDGWVVYWLALAGSGEAPELEGTARYLELGEKAVRASVETVTRSTTLSHFLQRAYHGSDSALYDLFSPLLPETLVGAFARGTEPQVRRRLERFLTILREVRPFIDGHDLLAMGAGAGPRIGDVLQRVFAAQLDGLVTGRQEALEEARRLLSRPEAG